jgi:hypothetical protein
MFLHQTDVTIQGAEYTFPYDDQGNMSSTLAGAATSLTITVGPWVPLMLPFRGRRRQ